MRGPRSEASIEHPASPADASTGDASLVARARAGDRDAVEQLVARYLSEVYDVAYRVLGERELAQDAAQDAFINALRGLARFRGDASFRTWLLRITVNAARSAARRHVRRREVALPPELNLVHDGPDPAARAALGAESDRVTSALQRLPEKQRLAVSLRTYRGLSYAEIGRLLDSSEGAARVNYHLGVKRLRGLLQE